MPYLCKLCKAPADKDGCECGAPTVYYDKLYEHKIYKQCIICNSGISYYIHSEHPDILNEPRFVFLRCPNCKKYTMHSLHLLSSKSAVDASTFIQSKFMEELRKK
jgi:hypothetical protein